MTIPFLPIALAAFGAGLSKIGQDSANDENAEQAQKNRDFQREMSNTQYQRAVADLRAAGLNPALAYQQGGAGNVSGSSAASMQNSLSGAAQATQAIPSTSLQQASLANINAQTEKTKAEMWGQIIDNKFANERNQTSIGLQAGQTYKTKADIEQTVANTDEIRQRISQLDRTNQISLSIKAQELRQAIASADRAKVDAKTAELQQEMTRLGIPAAKAQADFYEKAGPLTHYFTAAQQLVNLLKGLLP